MPEDRENNNDKWIMVTSNSKTKKLLNIKSKPKLSICIFYALSTQRPHLLQSTQPCTANQQGQNHHNPRPTRAPQAKKNLPGASTSHKHYGGYAKVTICSLTTASPTLRTNAPPSPRVTPTMQDVWQSIPPWTAQPTNHHALPTWPQYTLWRGFCITSGHKKAKQEETC